MTAQPKALQVVQTVGVRLPDIDERASNRRAAPGQDEPGEFHHPTRHARLDQIRPFGRTRLEVRAGRLANRRFIAVMTSRRRRCLLAEGAIEGGNGNVKSRGDERAGKENATPRRQAATTGTAAEGLSFA